MIDAFAQGVQHIGHEEDLWRILEYAAYALLALGGLLMKVIWGRQTELYQAQADVWKEIAKVKLTMATEYVKEDDFKEAIGSLKTEFHDTIKPLCDRVTRMDDFLRRVPASVSPPRQP